MVVGEEDVGDSLDVRVRFVFSELCIERNMASAVRECKLYIL